MSSRGRLVRDHPHYQFEADWRWSTLVKFLVRALAGDVLERPRGHGVVARGSRLCLCFRLRLVWLHGCETSGCLVPSVRTLRPGEGGSRRSAESARSRARPPLRAFRPESDKMAKLSANRLRSAFFGLRRTCRRNGKTAGGNGKARTMARPAKSLHSRVLENRFRPRRYGPLLGSEPPLPSSPFRDQRRRELWQALRQIQRLYRQERAPRLREHYAGQFSRLVRALHGAPLPGWYRQHQVVDLRILEHILANVSVGSEDDDSRPPS